MKNENMSQKYRCKKTPIQLKCPHFSWRYIDIYGKMRANSVIAVAIQC